MEEVKNLNLHELYANKANEMKEKYHDAIYAIADKYGVDLGIAFDMLKAICRGGNYGEGIDINTEELKKDYLELADISEQIAKMNGLL